MLVLVMRCFSHLHVNPCTNGYEYIRWCLDVWAGSRIYIFLFLKYNLLIFLLNYKKIQLYLFGYSSDYIFQGLQ